MQWQINSETIHSTFHVSLSPASFNNYTVTGLESYNSDATIAISVTAHNAAGTKTSHTPEIVGGFVMSQNENQSCSNENTAIVGGVMAGCVILAIAVVAVALLIYHFKSNNKR